ncbi:MAG TPA: zinc-ribbon domain-containing protein [Conexivisphaerales archaeon]|nr:zinc-ribbon domain-containing protein [Conexivisphaerales archaeon]
MREKKLDMGAYGYYCSDCSKCTKCGKELTKEEAEVLMPSKDLICTDCLAKLKRGELDSSTKPISDSARLLCSYCGKEIQTEDEFCPTCGARNLNRPLAYSPPPEMNVRGAEDGRPMRSDAKGIGRQAPSPTKWKFCPECGCKLPYQTAKFCPECGFDLTSRPA